MTESIKNLVDIQDVEAMSHIPAKDADNNGEFQKFPKIPRLNRMMVITEKIDGTNGQIFISKDGKSMQVGSRNRWLTRENDNYGFRAWAWEHVGELFECLGPGRHFGEWWGRGIQRGYNLDHRRFSLFNVRRWRHAINDRWNEHPWLAEYEKRQKVPACCHVIPILSINPFGAGFINLILAGLGESGSVAAPGFMQPEGIVIYHTAGNNLFKITFENDAEWKGKRK